MHRTGEMTLDQARRLLGLDASASPEVMKAAYKAAVKTAHPDHGGTAERLRLTLEAWRILEGRPAPSASYSGSSDHHAHDSIPRLEITPVLAVVGGRLTTRLHDGRKVAVALPAGLRQGDKIMVSGMRLMIAIKGRPDMFVSGDDLCMTVPVNETILRDGGHLKVKTPMGSRMVWAPKQVGTNRIVRITGQGLPAAGRHQLGALVLKLVPEKSAKVLKRGERASA